MSSLRAIILDAIARDNPNVEENARLMAALLDTDTRTPKPLLVDSAGRLLVTSDISVGATSFAHGVDSATDVASEILASRTTRRGVIIRNMATDEAHILYVGGAGVSTATGYPVLAGEAIRIDSIAAVFGVAPSGVTIATRYFETYGS